LAAPRIAKARRLCGSVAQSQDSHARDRSALHLPPQPDQRRVQAVRRSTAQEAVRLAVVGASSAKLRKGCPQGLPFKSA